MKKKLKILAGSFLIVALIAQILIMIFFKNGVGNLLLNLLTLLAIVLSIFLGVRSATYVEEPRHGEDWKKIISEETSNAPSETMKNEK